MSLNAQLLEQIREANLNYLLIAQRLIQEDKITAMVRLGLDEDTVEIINNLSTQQLIKLAGHNSLICSFRRTDHKYWQAHLDERRQATASHFHASILLADQTLDIQTSGESA